MQVGDVLADRYELAEVVGTGGMSTVYRARDRVLERNVAIKVMHPQFSGQADYVDRFRHEARAMAALSHPNIVTIIARGEAEGREYIVFEYIAGANLKTIVEREGPLPVDRALTLILDVCAGLAHAHANGVVHRDVKPQNVLLDEHGRPKVTDFGIAYSEHGQQATTQAGSLLGTADYLSPEQAEGDGVDERTDIYSLGVVLFELLTATVPFGGENAVAVAVKHVSEVPPRVRELRPDISPRLDDAVAKALAKDPAARFQTMDEFSRELEACRRTALPVDADDSPTGELTMVTPPPPRPPRQRRRRRFSLSFAQVLSGLALAAAVIIYLLFIRGSSTTTHHGGTTTNGGSGGTGAAVHVTAVQSYDPYGNNHTEHPELVQNATDGNSATAWTTERYKAGLDKQGVGIVLDAGSAVALHSITITTDTPGYTAEIEQSSSPDGGFSAPISPQATISGTTTRVTVDGSATRYYLIWITDLGGLKRAAINEVTAES